MWRCLFGSVAKRLPVALCARRHPSCHHVEAGIMPAYAPNQLFRGLTGGQCFCCAIVWLAPMDIARWRSLLAGFRSKNEIDPTRAVALEKANRSCGEKSPGTFCGDASLPHFVGRGRPSFRSNEFDYDVGPDLGPTSHKNAFKKT